MQAGLRRSTSLGRSSAPLLFETPSIGADVAAGHRPITPGIAASSFDECPDAARKRVRSGSAICARGMVMRTNCTCSGSREARLHGSQRQKRADHQPGAHQQHERERHLHDDQRVARAVPLAALARRAAAAARAGAMCGPAVPDDRNHCRNSRRREQRRDARVNAEHRPGRW